MCCFRFKLWWMTQRMGTCGKEVPLETQFMLVESKDDGEDATTVYTVFLPLLEGQFRAALQGNEQNQIEICLESGKPLPRAGNAGMPTIKLSGPVKLDPSTYHRQLPPGRLLLGWLPTE